jgi:hypothetical protein
MNIQIKKLVKGALIGESGYIRIASTAEVSEISTSIENYGQNLFSPDYASLFAIKADDKKSLSVVHIQGQHEGYVGRMYDTRNFYTIDANEIRKCDSKIGTIISNLPKLKKFNNKELGTLSSDLPVKNIQGIDNAIATNLYGFIMQAIVERKYLLIKLDDKSSWKENGVLENAEATTFFAAIDKLPELLRPVASFALSVDDKYPKEFLKEFLIILYHGNNNFGFNSTIEINWSDLKSKTNTNSYTDFYTTLAKLVISSEKDFFDTDLSSMGMLINIYDKSKDDNLKNSVEYLIIQKDWDKLIKHPDIIAKIQAKAEKSDFDLSWLYKFFENNKQKEIRDKYAELYCQIKSTLQVSKQIEILKAILNIPDTNIEKELKTLLLDKLTLQILNTNLNFDEWLEVAELVSSSKFEQQFIEKTAEQDLNFFEKLFKSNKYKKIAEKSFKETFAYKNNSDELCKKPFVKYVSADKLRSLRMRMLSNCENSNYKELYKGITLEEINTLSIKQEDDKHIIKLVINYLPNNDKEFIQQNHEIVSSQIEYALYNISDIKNSDIYTLYKKTGIAPTKPQIKLGLNNLKMVFDNAKVLQFDITSEITEFYKANPNVSAWHKIHEITKQNPPKDIVLNEISKETELDHSIYLKEKGVALPEFDVKKLILSIKQQQTDNIDLTSLLEKLKMLDISYSEYKDLIISKMAKKISNKEKTKFIEKYFGTEETSQTQSTDKKSIISKFKNIKQIKVWLLIVIGLLLLGIGFGLGRITKPLSDVTPTKTMPNDSIQKQDAAKKTQSPIVVQNNDSIFVYYRMLPAGKTNISDAQEKYTEKQNKAFHKADKNAIYNFIDGNVFWIDSVKTDKTYIISKVNNGPISRKAVKEKLQPIINNE